MEDVLVFGGIELVAVLICAPFALRRPTPPDAWVAGAFGVLGVGSVIAFLMGLYGDDWDFKGGIAWLGMLLVAAPLSLIVGVIAGAFFSWRVRRRLAAAVK